jgi:hypothetical protein
VREAILLEAAAGSCFIMGGAVQEEGKWKRGKREKKNITHGVTSFA